MKNFYQQVYDLVAQIPYGRVMTYGQIAIFLHRSTAARAVGYALHQLPPGNTIPWQRVINAQGKISPRSAGALVCEPSLQRLLLEQEGIEFDENGKIDLSHYLWEPPTESLLNGIFHDGDVYEEESDSLPFEFPLKKGKAQI
ncbi:methyltransferase [candidate division KSB3 bacterium]|uniref:Methyltransferase n=1 Tax=candidate division KSB3 bacterium TaxID=2044937 RepID=A0A2G6KDD8_9BACT|nr:MAG: methyltransferase [candidate division KSB3 bacterium]